MVGGLLRGVRATLATSSRYCLRASREAEGTRYDWDDGLCCCCGCCTDGEGGAFDCEEVETGFDDW